MQALFPLSATHWQRDENHHVRFSSTYMKNSRYETQTVQFVKVFTIWSQVKSRDGGSTLLAFLYGFVGKIYYLVNNTGDEFFLIYYRNSNLYDSLKVKLVYTGGVVRPHHCAGEPRARLQCPRSDIFANGSRVGTIKRQYDGR